MIEYTTVESALGTVLMTSDGRALTGLYFVGQKYQPQPASGWKARPGLKLFKDAHVQFIEYLGGKRQNFDLPINLLGTPFQVRVWHAIASIPFGSTLSYREVAERAGSPKAVRAVGAAVGRNPLTIIIPCHRVVGSNGSLTGYAGGLKRKQALLNLESSVFHP